MTRWMADKFEIEIDNKIGQYMTEQSWLGFEYFSDGVRSKGERDIVKSRPYVEENNRIESVANAKAVDFERFTGSFVLQSIMPDFSPYYYLCPERCPDCILSTSEILCRICCPDMFHTPLAYTDMVMESTYTYTTRVMAWMQEQLSSLGLRLVYLNWVLNDYSNNQNQSMQEIRALIRNFHWEHQMKTGDSLKLENDSSYQPSEICGYYMNTSQRTHGKIIGGEVVDKMRLYPWQVSLATGFLGMFYSHTCGWSTSIRLVGLDCCTLYGELSAGC